MIIFSIIATKVIIFLKTSSFINVSNNIENIKNLNISWRSMFIMLNMNNFVYTHISGYTNMIYNIHIYIQKTKRFIYKVNVLFFVFAVTIIISCKYYRKRVNLIVLWTIAAHGSTNVLI